MNTQEKEVLQSLRPSRVVTPVLIGIAVVVYLLYTQFDRRQFEQIQWDGRAWAWIALAFVLLVLRHLSYSMRMRALTGGRLGWKKAIEICTIWEFSGCIAPTSKGGPVVSMFVLPKEGVPLGQTVTAVLYTIILDSGFFVLLLPVLLWSYGPGMLFPGMTSFGDVSLASGAFFTIYGMMASYWLALMLLVIIRPQLAPLALGWLSRLPLLRRKKQAIERAGMEFALAATGLRRQSWKVHLQAIGGTLGAWILKFTMINCLLIAVAPQIPLDGTTQLLIYSRLVAMFIIMAFSPTPGGAGLAEAALPRFISDFVPLSVGLIVALLWRAMAWYGYLLAGAIVVPQWIARNFSSKTKT